MMIDKTQEVYEQFLRLEEKENLFECLEIKDIKIWKYLRFEIFDIVACAFGREHNTNLDKNPYMQQASLKNWIEENILNSQFRVCQKDVLIFNHARRVKEGKYYRCIYTDEWVKHLEKSYYIYELPYAERFHFNPVKTKNLRYINYDNYDKRFHKSNFSEGINRTECKNLCANIVGILEKEFNINLGVKDKRKILSNIFNVLVARVRWRDYYKYLLDHIKPKIIMYVVGYSWDRMVLTELAKERGIPTVELQHGHIANGHISYNFNNIHELNSFPDYLFVFGQREKDAMKRLPISKENVYVVGSPELDLKTEYYKKKLLNKKKKKKIITLISGGEYEIADAALELSQKLDKKEYKVYLKLHPVDYKTWRKRYKMLINSDVEVVDDCKHDIYYYLAVSDFVIGIESTALFEATRFQCNIMILKKCWYLRVEGLVQTGNAVYIDSMDEAIERIRKMDKKRIESDYFYCKNSCQLICRAIDNILDKKKGEI